MFNAKGKIVYNATRNFKDKSKTDNWVSLELFDFEDTTSYYRWLIDRYWWEADKFSYVKRSYVRPSHPPHVSIIRGENILNNNEHWGKFLKNKIINVQYSPNVRQTGGKKDYFWFLDFYFDEFNLIRKYYGLDTSRDNVPFHGHCTIARVF
jgi:hypothetical protein